MCSHMCSHMDSHMGSHMGSHYKDVHWFVLRKVITHGTGKEQTYLAKILHDFLNQTGKAKVALRAS